MFPSHEAQHNAIAFQLAAALEQYEPCVDRLVARGYDPELYASMTKQFDQMRLYASSLPAVSVAWVALMISRFELTHTLWKGMKGEPDAHANDVYAQHKNDIAALRERCTRVIAAS